MSVSRKDIDAFEAAIVTHFAFLQAELNMRYAGINLVDDDPRDSCVVAKYRQGEFRIDIAWNPFARSLGILIRLDNEELKRRERYVYLEPFVEFTSGGDSTPVVPQIYPGMCIGKIEKTMQQRDELFAHGFIETLRKLAERLRKHLPSVRDCPTETIRKYQAWYQSRGKAV